MFIDSSTKSLLTLLEINDFGYRLSAPFHDVLSINNRHVLIRLDRSVFRASKPMVGSSNIGNASRYTMKANRLKQMVKIVTIPITGQVRTKRKYLETIIINE